MTYIVVETLDTQAFVEEVNEWIAKGFVPQGGISCTRNKVSINVEQQRKAVGLVVLDEYIVYTQAMVKKD